MRGFLSTISPMALGNSRFVVLLGLSYLIAIILALVWPYLPLIVIAAIIFIYYSLRNTFFALCVLTVLHFFYIRSTEEINVFEVGFGIYAFLILSWWMFRRFFLDRRPLLDTPENKALMLFLLLCLFSLVPALLGQVSLMRWFRELIPLSFYLFFFIFLDEAISKWRIKILATCFLIMGTAIAVKNIWTYYELVNNAEKVWEYLSSRQTSNEPVLLTVFAVSLSLGTYLKNRTQRMLSLLISVSFGMSLILTFSRGYWLAAAIAGLTILLISDSASKLRLLRYGILGVLFLLSIALVLFGALTQFIIDIFVERFETIASAGASLSLQERWKESYEVISYIKLNPIIGYGLGKMYSFRSMIGREMPTHYMHNAYLYFLFKVGLVALLAFLFFYLRIIYNGFKSLKNMKDPYLRGLVTGLVGLLISFLPLSITSPQFTQKDSILIIFLSGAFICSISRHQSVTAGRSSQHE